MVEREKWGDLREILEEFSNDEIYELCYLLKLPISGSKDKKIKRILKSEFSEEYVQSMLNLLNFYLSFIDYFYADELTEIIQEYDLPGRRTKWDKLVEILKSGEISPRELIGMLTTPQVEEFYTEMYEEEPEGERDELIDKILSDRGFEIIFKSGFIMMSMVKDPFLTKTYQIIKDVCKKYDINAERIDELQSSELITKEIIEKIESAEYLFVDLTGERPNVYYELGYCHGFKKDKKKIILMSKKGTERHFDIHGMRTIIYENHAELRKRLKERLQAIRN